MTGSERNSFERKLQKDQFAEEAMEGFASIPDGELYNDLTELNQRLGLRVKGNRISIFYRIAASVAVLMIISSVFILIQRKQPKSAMLTPEASDVIFDIAKAEPVYNPGSPEKKQAAPPQIPAGSEERAREVIITDNTDVVVSDIPDEQVFEENQVKELEKDLLAKQEQKQYEIAYENSAALDEVQNESVDRAKKAENVASGGVAAVQPAAAMRSKSRQETTLDTPPLPEGGMDAFNKYIRENTGLTRGETITVETAFVVDVDGRPDTIRVLKNPPNKYADEAAKLIRSGPKWKPAVRNGIVVEEEVRLRIILPVK